MADQFCPHCGTEVDADARFCPTCGRTLLAEEPDQAGEQAAAVGSDADETSAIPPAPEWPAAGTPQEEPNEEPGDVDAAVGAEEPPDEEAAPAAPPPPPSPPPASVPPPAAPAPEPAGGSDLPFTVPVMLSGWLIGAGSGFGALALLPTLGSLLNILLFLALLWVTATVFLADRMPSFPQQRLAVLVVLLVSTGAALDRAAFRVNGVYSIFLIAMLVAAAGALLIELGRDRPVQTGSS